MVRIKNDLSFTNFYNALGNSYRSLDARALTIQKNGEWINYGAILSPTMRDEQQVRLEQETDTKLLQRFGITKIAEIKNPHEVTKASVLPALFDQASKGNLTIGNVLMKLRLGYDRVSYASYDTYGVKRGEFQDFPALCFYILSQQHPSAEFGAIDLRSKLLSFGLTEETLIARWFKAKGFFPAVNCVITFPIYISLVSPKYLGNNKVEIGLKAHKTLLPTFNILVILRRYIPESGDMTLDVFNEKLSSLPQVEQGDFAYINHTIEFETVPTENDTIDVNVTNEALGVVTEESRNVRYISPQREFQDKFLYATSQFIAFDALEELLFKTAAKVGSSQASDKFETATAWILSLMGFKTIKTEKLGVLKQGKFPEGETDIIAHDIETKRIFVVSCSLKPPPSDKIDKIANLAGALASRGVLVEPLMVVSEEAGEVKRNTRRVKVLDKSDLQRIMSSLRQERIPEARTIILAPSI